MFHLLEVILSVYGCWTGSVSIFCIIGTNCFALLKLGHDIVMKPIGSFTKIDMKAGRTLIKNGFSHEGWDKN